MYIGVEAGRDRRIDLPHLNPGEIITLLFRLKYVQNSNVHVLFLNFLFKMNEQLTNLLHAVQRLCSFSVCCVLWLTVKVCVQNELGNQNTAKLLGSPRTSLGEFQRSPRSPSWYSPMPLSTYLFRLSVGILDSYILHICGIFQYGRLPHNKSRLGSEDAQRIFTNIKTCVIFTNIYAY